MNRERFALGFAAVLTVLYAGAMVASLTGRAQDWSNRLNPAALHLIGAIAVVAIVVNLSRRETPKP